jgi:tetratricopeptide (TPR) repeat protein
LSVNIVQSSTHAALDRDPSDALALATEGFVYCHLLKDLDTARKRCDEAVEANPSHALGWLYRSTVNAFKGEGLAAVHATRRAIELSPLDPQRYYFQSLGRRQSYRLVNMRMPKGLRARRLHSIARTPPHGEC